VTWLRHSMPRGGLSPAQIQPCSGPVGLVRTQSVLTVDRSTLIVDLAHMSVTQRLGTHMSVRDIMLTS